MGTLQEELDRSFGDGPPPPPVSRHVAAGRRALLRRRVTTGVAGVAAAVVATTGYAVSSGSARTAPWVDHERVPAATSTPVPTVTATPTGTPDDPQATEEPWARLDVVR